MKKLFTLALSALALVGLSGCGENYSKDVLAAGEGVSYHAVGGFEGAWAAKAENKMEATSVAEVAKLDKALAKTLAKKSLQHLYVAKIEIKAESAGWETNTLVNGEVKKVDGKFTLKAIEAAWNAEEETYTNTHWIPNPADTDCCHLEALTENLFVPPYQKEKDANGFSWADNPVMNVEEGFYHVVVAKYTATSTEAVAGYGFGVVAAK